MNTRSGAANTHQTTGNPRQNATSGRPEAVNGRTGSPQNFNNISRPQGQATVTRTSNGGSVHTFANKTSIERDAGGHATRYSDPGHHVDAVINPRNGRPTQISSGAMGNRTTMQRGAFNERRVERVRTVSGGVERVVSYGGWNSIQRPMAGRPGYVQRTVVIGDRSYGAVYHSYRYNGVILYSPVPAVVYAPEYYGFLLNPYPRPVIYNANAWGWRAQPWYGVYGNSFTPYASYSTPDQWLTDYVISAHLQQAYDNRSSTDGEQPLPMPQITDEEKALIAQDIREELARQQQLAAEPQIPVSPMGDLQTSPAPSPATGGNPPPNISLPSAQPPTPEALKDHLFVVFIAPIEVKQTSGQTCKLTEGDMLFRTGSSANPDNTVDVLVKASHADPAHPELCPQQAQTKVALTDLQEMYNRKKDLLAQGEQKQAELAGKQGIPKGPAPKATQYGRGKANADAAAMADLKQMLKTADDTEKEVSAVGTGGS